MGGVEAPELVKARVGLGGVVTARLDLKDLAPLVGSLQLVRQISYFLIQCHRLSTRNDAFERHQERAEPTRDCETGGGGRSRSNKGHRRGEGKQDGGQYQSTVARQCCDQDWKQEKQEKQEKGERANAETLQKLAQVFDMLGHYTISSRNVPHDNTSVAID
jgi:hypothetical protein